MGAPQPMPHDPVSGQTVLHAAARGQVPRMIGHQDARSLCPFCPGRDDQLEKILAERRIGVGGGWLARAVANKYPMVGAEGCHEVLIGSPRHTERLAELTDGESARFLGLWQERLEHCLADPRRLAPVVFLNQGPAAGASQPHLHAQLVGMTEEPALWRERRTRLAHADCAVCAQLREQAALPLDQEGDLRAWLPLQSRTGLVRIAPIDHLPAPRALEQAGPLVRRICAAIDAVTGADLNVLLYAWRPDQVRDAHWHLEIVPRVSGIAGFELATGIVTNSSEPVTLARRLGAWL